jgi:NADPH-dependent curcumin reductase CurA
MREILSKSLTLRGFINYEFAEKHYADFVREVGAGIADGRIYREDLVDGLENAPQAFIGRDARWSQFWRGNRTRGRIDA